MRIARVLMLLPSIFCFAAAGHTQIIPDVLIAGQATSAIAYGQPGWCAITQGSSAIQRNQAAGIAVISFPELTLFDGTTYYLLNGQAHLKFTTKTSGIVHFKQTAYPTAINTSPFNQFSQTFNGARYIVHFTITFANNCTLPVTANFEAP